MREILFRGKRVDNGEWACGYFEKYNGRTYINLQTERLNSGGYPIRDFIEVIPETVGQYTGLTDRNGKKVFEGDIIKTKEFGKDSGNGVNFNNFDIFEVIYSSASFKLNNSRRLFNMIRGQKFEVIGNIHDDPELLEVE